MSFDDLEVIKIPDFDKQVEMRCPKHPRESWVICYYYDEHSHIHFCGHQGCEMEMVKV